MELISITSMYINVGLITGNWKAYLRGMELLVFGEA